MGVNSALFSTILLPSTIETLPLLSKPLALHLSSSSPKFHLIRAASSSTASGNAKEPRGIMKPRRVSPEMAEFVQATEISRTQVLKLVWAHIKDRNLQDPQNKKVIICDEKLKKIFRGKDRVGFLEIAGLISAHFPK